MPLFELNLTAYSWGLGLVMAGWIGGLFVSYAFSLAMSPSKLIR